MFPIAFKKNAEQRLQLSSMKVKNSAAINTMVLLEMYNVLKDYCYLVVGESANFFGPVWKVPL
jgi:hypothetical protein